MSSANLSGLDSYLDVEESESRQIQPHNLRRLIGYILRHKAPLAVGLLMIFLSISTVLFEPRLFGYAIDDAIVPKDWARLRIIGVVFLATICVRVLAVIGQAYFFELLGQRVAQDFRCELFSHLQRLPVSVYDRNPAGRLLTRVTNDVASLGEMFSAGFVSMIGNALMVLGILVWLLVLNFRLGLISASVFPILVVVTFYFSKKLKGAYRDSRSRLSALNAFFAENLLGMRVVNLFNRQRLHMSRFERINQWYADSQIATIRIYAFFQPAITLASGISIALVIWYGGIEAREGGLQVGVLSAYFAYVLSLFQPLRELADKWNIFLSGMASAERIFSVLDWPTELPGVTREIPAAVAAEIRGHVVFENVWFAYDKEHWVLKDFSVEIRPGMRIGIVGHTGAGKTTLISLLMRFYEPQRGRILLDGKDLREYDKRALRAAFGVVQQDVFVFSGGIRDNITFWGQSEGQGVQQALEKMGFGEWWKAESEKLQERGVNLSMGQRQVLAFARALAVDPKIWILDEATANMDSMTEKFLDECFELASARRTTILIAHRLATVRTADRILVLHKGALVESGAHRELIEQNGLYARLYRYQMSQEPSGTPDFSQRV